MNMACYRHAVKAQSTLQRYTFVRFTERVRVILLAEEERPTMTLIDQLLQNPVRVAGSTPLTREEIYEHS